MVRKNGYTTWALSWCFWIGCKEVSLPMQMVVGILPTIIGILPSIFCTLRTIIRALPTIIGILQTIIRALPTIIGIFSDHCRTLPITTWSLPNIIDILTIICTFTENLIHFGSTSLPHPGTTSLSFRKAIVYEWLSCAGSTTLLSDLCIHSYEPLYKKRFDKNLILDSFNIR